MKSRKVKELMIGNIVVIDRGVGEVCRTTTSAYNEWNTDDDYPVSVDINGQYYDCTEEELIPIEITPKILRAIGFEQEDRDFLGYDMSDWYSLSTEYFHISIRSGLSNTDGRCWNANVSNELFDTVASCDVQYLHQLQNIVTLAGYELKINAESLRSEK